MCLIAEQRCLLDPSSAAQLSMVLWGSVVAPLATWTMQGR